MRHRTRALSALAALLIVASSLPISCYAASQLATEALGEPPQNISKRERQLVEIIEDHALTFEIEKFVKDPVLIQTQQYTKYINPKATDPAHRVVLKKKNEDTGKDTVVLSSMNNRFAIPTPRGAKKRQFVLLRRAANQGQNSDEVSYYASLIYVRNLYPNDTNKQTFEVDGVQSVVEFDIFEQRPRKFFAGWSSCDFTFLFTCASVAEIQSDAKKAKGGRRKRMVLNPAQVEDPGESHLMVKRGKAPPPPPPPPKLTPIVSEPDFDPGNYNDLYLDLDFHRYDEMFKAEMDRKKQSSRRRKRSLGEDDAALTRNKRFAFGGKGKGSGKASFGSKGSARGGISGMLGAKTGGGLGGGIGGAMGAAANVGAGLFGGAAAAAGGLMNAGMNVGGGFGGGGGGGGKKCRGRKKKDCEVEEDLNSQAGGGGGLFGGAEGGISGGSDIGGGVGASGGLLAGLGGNLMAGIGGGANAMANLGGGVAGGIGGGLSGGLGAGGLLGGSSGINIDAILGGGAGGSGGMGGLFGGLMGGTAGGDISTGLVMGAADQGLATLVPLANAGGGVSGALDSTGLSGVLDLSTGIADTVVQTGDQLLSTWDTLGNQMVETAAAALAKMGVPEDFAKLATLGGQLATNSWSGVFGKAGVMGWRIGVDTAGTNLNGGPYAGKGFDGPDSVPSNENSIFGVLYPGAEEGKYFFFPQGSLIRVKVKQENGNDAFEGWFEPKITGVDAIYPDDEAAYAEFVDKDIKILPVEYQTKDPETKPGIGGKIQPGYKFVREGKKITGVYKPEDEDMEEKTWVPRGIADNSTTGRPAKTPDGDKVLYGYLFNGIEDSPHIFIAEGDSISGVFVPADADHPELSETPHGVLTPDHPAGHAVFVADDPREVENIEEVRGTFMPDAMDLSGGISGRLSKSQECNCDIKFSFILDRPAVEFVYVHGKVNVKNVWSPYISPDEWNYEPPNDGGDDGDDDKDKDDQKPKTEEAPKENEEEEEDEEDVVPEARYEPPPKPTEAPDSDEVEVTTPAPTTQKPVQAKIKEEYPGAKIKTKHSLVFVPEDFEIYGTMIPVCRNTSKKYPPVRVTMNMKKTDDPWEFKVVQKSEDSDKEKLPDRVVAIFIPQKFVAQDALIGLLDIDKEITGGKITVKDIMPFEPHIWTVKDEVWTPIGFLERMQAETDAVGQPLKEREKIGKDAEEKTKEQEKEKEEKRKEKLQKQAEEEEKKHKEKEEKMKEQGKKPRPKQNQKQKKVKQAAVPGAEGDGPPRKVNNTLQGRMIESPERGGVEMDEVNEDPPDEYVHGFHIKCTPSPEPIFVPDTGVLGIFTADGGKDIKGYYFPKKDDLESLFVPLKEHDLDGKSGQFQSLDSNDQLSKGFLKGKLEGSTIKMNDEVEILPGWEMDDIAALTKEDMPEGAEVPNEHFTPTVTGQKYALVDIGGGYKGVVIEDPTALDDPNNPLFQEFLHYRSTRDGDVNPWGKVQIVEPVTREKGDGISLAPGKITEIINDLPNGMSAEIMGGFSLNLWDYPVVVEFKLGVKLNPNKLGNKGNVANMMDWRMYLFKKYTCKRAQLGDKSVTIIAPKGADGFVKLKAHAKPRQEWLNLVGTTNAKMIYPEEDGAAGRFAAQFEVNVDAVKEFMRPAGSGNPLVKNGDVKKDTGEWKTTAPFNKWGDVNSCDEIELDDFQASQAISALQDGKDEPGSNGITLGYKLVHGRGNRVKFRKLAKKLLKTYDRKVADGEKKKKKISKDSGASTDLMGGVSAQANMNAAVGGRGEKKDKKMKGDGEPGKAHAKSIPGWKTQYRIMRSNATLSDDGILFYGLGNCEFDDVADIDLLQSGKSNMVIKYFLYVMRIACDPESERRVVELINQGFLKLSDDGGFFVVPKDKAIFGQQRLTPNEIKKISLAVEFHAVTRTYYKMRERGFQTTGMLHEPNCLVSRSVAFLTELAIYTIGNGRKITPTHGVRLNRNLLVTLRTTMTKLHQDSLKLQAECPTSCEVDKKLTEGDKFRIMSLINFVIYGLGPYHKGEKKVRAAFNTFVELNTPALKERVQEFERQFPKPTGKKKW